MTQVEIKIPSMGESITEVMIGQIFVSENEFVATDAEILEIETDKVNQALYAQANGLVHLTVKKGDAVQVGQVIGFIDVKAQALETAKETVEKPAIPEIKIVKEAETPKKIVQDLETAKEQRPSLRLGKPQFLESLHSPKAQAPASISSSSKMEKNQLANPISETSKETRRPLSKIRQVIAKRLVESQHTMAMLTTFNEVDLTAVIQLRERYKEEFIKTHGIKLGFMPFFVKASVEALEEFPVINSYIDKDESVFRKSLDIGIAVGTDRGLIVPVIRHCDRLSFAAIEKEIDLYAKKAKEGTLALADLQGGGFTITNGGTYGSLLSTPIVNASQCAILGMHKIEKRPVVINDEIVIRSMMYLALSYDHRIVDGKEAVLFLGTIKKVLEDPSRLLFEI